MKKVYIVGEDFSVAEMFKANGWEITLSLWNADLIQFCGGHDVTPMIYGEDNTDSYYSLPRDIHEAGIYQIAKLLGKKMAGICRGGQFLNVMNGGKMVQHIEGHTQDHWLKMQGAFHEYQLEGNATSTHHQEMIPTPDAYVVAYGPNEVCEILMYEDDHSIHTLCFQPHPEWAKHPELTKLYFSLINKELFNEV